MFGDPPEHGADNCVAVFSGDLGEHGSYNRVVLVPAGCVRLARACREQGQRLREKFCLLISCQAAVGVQQHQQEWFPRTLRPFSLQRDHVMKRSFAYGRMMAVRDRRTANISSCEVAWLSHVHDSLFFWCLELSASGCFPIRCSWGGG